MATGAELFEAGWIAFLGEIIRRPVKIFDVSKW